jgi:hypothetical protein
LLNQGVQASNFHIRVSTATASGGRGANCT